MKTLLSSLLALTLALILPARSQPLKSLEDERLSQSGIAITIIFDDSGSMDSENRMVQAKAAFTQWLAGIPQETKLGLIALNRGMLVPLGQNNREAIKAAVASMTPNGSTPLARTIAHVGEMIEERRKTVTPYERHIVIAFTDGDDSEYSNERVVDELRKLGSKTIESVGIGFHGHGEYMRNGATQYYNAGDSAELVSALKQVASEVDQQSDIVVSPAIAASMANLPAAPVENVSDQSSFQTESHKKSSFLNKAILFILVASGYLIIKSIMSRKAGNSRR